MFTSAALHASPARVSAASSGRLPVPTRARPFAKTQRPTPLPLRLLLGRPLAPTAEEYAAACDDLRVGDPAMDAVVAWMQEVGMATGRALFMRAVREGVEAIPDCPQALRVFFDGLRQPPRWIEPEAIQDGVRFVQGVGLHANWVLRDLALMGGYLMSGFNQSLVKTGALDKGTSARVAETGAWWMHCTEPDVDQPGSMAWQSTLHVRLVHALVRQHLSRQPDWDEDHWGVPLSQTDMVATYLGFSVAMLGGLRKLGLPVTPRESRGVMHLWAYVGWLMGVSPGWLARSEQDGIVLLYHTVLTQSPPDDTSRQLGHALSREPLARHFTHLQTLQRWLAYHQHLSVSRYFLTAKQMHQLGLPGGILPWYPVLTLPARVGRYSLMRFLPPLRDRLVRKGRAEQAAALRTLFGREEAQVLRLSAGHPGAAHSGVGQAARATGGRS
ncbi:oxygenase MpaB family protein [Perlucidibaca piscinae]|uniref:oxygenase MpaB family protein n=1 Tax=Perlucidibaca piscinae TaxID=392589 RepID=UPI0003B51A11|nr:oxygenase MpaB family protein [Perlucidibaca piscinae]